MGAFLRGAEYQNTLHAGFLRAHLTRWYVNGIIIKHELLKKRRLYLINMLLKNIKGVMFL